MDNGNHKEKLRFIQLGDGPALRGLANEWMESAGNRAAYEGCAVFRPVSDEQKHVFEHGGQYSLYTTGIGKNGRATQKDIHCIKTVCQPDEWTKILDIASRENLQCILTDTTDETPASSKNDDRDHPRSLAGRVAALLFARHQNNRKGISVFCFEPAQNNAKRLQLAVMALAIEWSLPEHFLKWVMENNRFIPCYADRAVEIATEKESGAPILRVEGFGRILISDRSIPAFMQPLKAAGKEVMASADAYKRFEAEQNVWTMLLSSCALLAEALSLPGTNAPVYDDALRTWLGHMMLNEYLAKEKAPANLKSLADGMERLENEFFGTPPEMLEIDYCSVFIRHALPTVRNRMGQNKPCRRLIFMLALTVMESIRGQDKRFHALSSDMEPEALSYAVLSDEMLWGEDLRKVRELENMLASSVRDLQLLGIRESVSRTEKD